MNHLTENEQAMRARCDAATKGPWYLVTNIDGCDAIRPWVGCPDNGDGNDVLFSYEDDVWSEDGRTRFVNNALFTIAARQDLPACLDTIEKLRAELAEARETVTNLLRYDWSGAESRVGLIAMGAYNGKNESANIEFARTAKIEAAQDAARAFLAKIKEHGDDA